MDLFKLPKQTIVNKMIPKNAFDKYTNTQQKKLFTETVEKIKWLNKISKETINLFGKEINEIQIFEIELRKKEKIEALLDIIDKAIPYPIIFILKFNNERLVSATKKHSHPTNDNIAVIDWSFKSYWFSVRENPYMLNLKGSIDNVFNDFCFQLAGKKEKSIDELIQDEKEIKKLKNEAVKLQAAMKKLRIPDDTDPCYRIMLTPFLILTTA